MIEVWIAALIFIAAVVALAVAFGWYAREIEIEHDAQLTVLRNDLAAQAAQSAAHRRDLDALATLLALRTQEQARAVAALSEETAALREYRDGPHSLRGSALARSLAAPTLASEVRHAG